MFLSYCLTECYVTLAFAIHLEGEMSMFAQLPSQNSHSEAVAYIQVAQCHHIKASSMGLLGLYSALHDDLKSQVLCRDLLLMSNFAVHYKP